MSTLSAAWASAGTGPFYIHIVGLPTDYTWKDLKDLIRRYASHGIWTEMAVWPNGQGSGRGDARVQRKNEAEILYKYLVDEKDYKVHIFDITGSPPKLVDCTCRTRHGISSAAQREVDRLAGDTESWQIIPTGMPPQVSSMPQAAPVYSGQPQIQASMSYPTQISPYALAHVQALQLHQASLQQGTQPQYERRVQQMLSPATYQQSVYTSPTTGLPINIDQGYARTQFRGIFVKELDFSAQKHEIQHYFARAGNILKCERQKDSTGRFKGIAIIQYSSAQEADYAVKEFNGVRWKGRKLVVRHDREGTTITAPPTSSSSQQRTSHTGTPIIVNGSSGYAQVLQE